MRGKKVDKNQNVIVKALRQIGCTVFDASSLGKGFPDLVCGYRGKTILLEVKNPETKWTLTEDQIEFHERWAGGKVLLVTEPQEAIRAVVRNSK